MRCVRLHHRRVRLHGAACRRHRGVVRPAQFVDQRLLDGRGLRQRDIGEIIGVDAERDGGNSHEHQHAEAAPHPFARAERALHCGEHTSADKERQRQRGRSTRRISQQQERGLDVGALQRGTCQDQSQNRPRAGRPQQPRRDTEQQRGHEAPRRTICRLRQPSAKSDQRLRNAIRDGGKQQRNAEQREQHQGGDPAVFVGRDRPPTGNSRERRDNGECQRHADQHRQAAFQKRPVGPGEHERQNGKNAGADDGQHAAEIGQDEKKHCQDSR